MFCPIFSRLLIRTYEAGNQPVQHELSPRYYGWTIVALSFVLMMASYCLLYTYSVFVPSLEQDLGLTRAEIAAPFSLCVIVYSTVPSGLRIAR